MMFEDPSQSRSIPVSDVWVFGQTLPKRSLYGNVLLSNILRRPCLEEQHWRILHEPCPMAFMYHISHSSPPSRFLQHPPCRLCYDDVAYAHAYRAPSREGAGWTLSRSWIK